MCRKRPNTVRSVSKPPPPIFFYLSSQCCAVCVGESKKKKRSRADPNAIHSFKTVNPRILFLIITCYVLFMLYNPKASKILASLILFSLYNSSNLNNFNEIFSCFVPIFTLPSSSWISESDMRFLHT